jgi:hypothetical protein
MAFKKGQGRIGGRKKGSLNKTTLTVKEAMSDAFDQLGGVASFVSWARDPDNTGEFYKLWAKMLPAEVKTEITGKDGGPIEVTEVVISTRSQAEAVLRDIEQRQAIDDRA